MKYIKDLETLKDFCQKIAKDDFITFDTEFIRERTYKPELCLIQVAGKEEAAIIDIFAFKDLAPLIALFKDPNIVKVCHSGQQDIEIFYENYGVIPTPLADTQIMAMCDGYGDSVAYHGLVANICGAHLNKEMQMTDWKKRPLSHKQKEYAIADVTYLRKVYETLFNRLIQKKRIQWIEEEIQKLIDEENYKFNPEAGWQKIKVKQHNRPQLNIVKHLAEWRENEACQQNKNRARILSDDLIYELSIVQPKTEAEFSEIRKIKYGHSFNKNLIHVLLNLVQKALEMDPDLMPKMPKRKALNETQQSLLDMFKLLLKLISAQYEVAAKLIANVKEIEDFICNRIEKKPDFLKGWRYEIYGRLAEKIMQGKLFLGFSEGKIIFKEEN